jgi:uncharacterized membrane protein YeaQ/YmgE (transglycosylase-associated protein family)
MWKLLGLAHLSFNEQLLVLLVAICASLAVGWVMDLIMDRIGFGLFGNAIITFIGILVGIWIYNTYLGSMVRPDLTKAMGVIIASVMLHLVVLSVLRRALRL